MDFRRWWWTNKVHAKNDIIFASDLAVNNSDFAAWLRTWHTDGTQDICMPVEQPISCLTCNTRNDTIIVGVYDQLRVYNCKLGTEVAVYKDCFITLRITSGPHPVHFQGSNKTTVGSCRHYSINNSSTWKITICLCQVGFHIGAVSFKLRMTHGMSHTVWVTRASTWNLLKVWIKLSIYGMNISLLHDHILIMIAFIFVSWLNSTFCIRIKIKYLFNKI